MKHRFTNIVTDAAALGIRRTSLWAALKGHRPHPSALGRYYLLQAQRELHTCATLPVADRTVNPEEQNRN